MSSKIKPPDHARLNPCLKEQEMTFKCLNDNNYERDSCLKYMENYKNCKDFWGKVQAHRRRQGIFPHLPPPEEREKVKRDYYSSQK